jgi:hypothetical protein
MYSNLNHLSLNTAPFPVEEEIADKLPTVNCGEPFGYCIVM